MLLLMIREISSLFPLRVVESRLIVLFFWKYNLIFMTKTGYYKCLSLMSLIIIYSFDNLTSVYFGGIRHGTEVKNVYT